MGQLVDGVWQDIWYDTESTGGRFKRSRLQMRNLGDYPMASTALGGLNAK